MEIEADDHGNIKTIASGRFAVETSGQVVTAYIHSRSTMRMGLLGLAAFLVAVAATLVVFAPDGREHLTIFIGIALALLAAGLAGFAAFWIKTPALSVGAEKAGEDH